MTSTMDNYYVNSNTINGLERVSDLNQVGRTKEDDMPVRRKKRSRESFDNDPLDDIFKEVFNEMVYTDVFPTFRTFVLTNFYTLLSFNTDSAYYGQMSGSVLEFRRIIERADRAVYLGKHQDLYFLLVDDLVDLLRKSQSAVTLFHLDAKPVPYITAT